MMYRLAVNIVMLFLLGSVAVTYAGELEKTKKDIERALDLSGIKQKLDDVPVIINRAIKQRRREQVGDGQTDQLLVKELEKTYSGNRLVKEVAQRMTESYDPNRYAYIHQKLSSDLSAKMKGLREEVDQEGGLGEAGEAIKIYKEASKERKDLVAMLDNAILETEYSTGVQALSTLAVLSAAIAVESPERKFPVAAMMSNVYMQFLEPTRQQSQVKLAYAFKDVSDEDLKRYAHAYNEMAVAWFLDKAIDAINDVMLDSMDAVNVRLREQVKGEK